MPRRNMTTDGFNPKVYKQGTFQVTVPAIASGSSGFGQTNIAHGYGSSELLFQVCVGDAVAPYTNPTGGYMVHAAIDNTNLIIEVADSYSGGGTQASFTVDGTYRLLLP